MKPFSTYLIGVPTTLLVRSTWARLIRAAGYTRYPMDLSSYVRLTVVKGCVKLDRSYLCTNDYSGFVYNLAHELPLQYVTKLLHKITEGVDICER